MIEKKFFRQIESSRVTGCFFAEYFLIYS